MISQKQINLNVVIWTEQIGLFDYRSEEFDDQFKFKSYQFNFPVPKRKDPVYYFIHQLKNKISNTCMRFEKRDKLESTWDDKETVKDYKLIGGFAITNSGDEGKKAKISVRLIAAKNILINNDRLIKQTSHFLPMWIIRTLDNEFTLKERHILKFGRIQLEVQQIRINPSSKYVSNEEGEILNLDEKVSESHLGSMNQQKKCRVCLSSEDEEDANNVLINPCQCKGSIEYIHINCLKQWLDSKLTKVQMESNGNVKVADKDCCEICKMKLPFKLIKDGNLISLINFIEEMAYVMFRPISMGDVIGGDNCFYVTFGEEDCIKIGRLSENGLLLNDQTVSRNHASLAKDGDRCILKDEQSKYGTLVYDKDYEVKLSKNMRAFQIQNTAFCFTYS